MKNNFNVNLFILFIFSIIIIYFIYFFFYNKNKEQFNNQLAQSLENENENDENENVLNALENDENENDENENDENDENEIDENEKKIVYITSIYGDYEKTCKPFIKQTIPSDFICFTNNKNLINNGWIIDNTEYHLLNKSNLDNNEYVNSLNNNKHNFNIAKYYKQAFINIPRLKKYDVVVWLDGSIEITNEKTSEWILNNIYKEKIIGWEHEFREGKLKNEVDASIHSEKYISPNWNGQKQPIQDINKQYQYYLNNNYDENIFKNHNSNKKNLGVWVTCFVAFLQKDPDVIKFLNDWYLQTLKYSTQDQIGFTYIANKNFIPYTLPNNIIKGLGHSKTDFYIKHNHYT